MKEDEEAKINGETMSFNHPTKIPAGSRLSHRHAFLRQDNSLYLTGCRQLVFVFTAAAMAAPVGVTSSPATCVMCRRSPPAAAILTTAGTGIGKIPC